jgi:alpha galactosidase A-like protein
MRRILLVALALVGLLAAPAEAKVNLKPFMGWSSWSVESSTRATYGTNWLTEGNIRNAADAMAAKIAPAGYTYLNIDSGWNATMGWTAHFDGNGIPDPDSTRFPSGLPSLSSYVHGKGLKLGLYLPAGLDHAVYDNNLPITGTSCRTRDIAVQPLTATNKWGSHWKINYSSSCAQAYIDSIVARFASWNVDFIKVDGVTLANVADIQAFSAAIDRSGRAMWLTASAWPVDRAAAPGLRASANSVRIDTDIECYCATISSWTSSVDDRRRSTHADQRTEVAQANARWLMGGRRVQPGWLGDEHHRELE